MSLLRTALLSTVLGLAALLPSGPTHALDPADLLPVDEAFALSASATSREAITLHFVIADGYYLYRHRTAVEVLGEGFTPAELVLPDGVRHTDEFFGEVETWRHSMTATLPGSTRPGTESVRLRVSFQGCADVGVCYPPTRREVAVVLPSALAAAPRGLVESGLLASGRRGSDLLGPATSTGAVGPPLPDTEAFRVEAISDGADRIAVRFSIEPGYYLYRDKTTFKASSAAGASVTTGDWPPAQIFSDQYFGEQAVYFDEALVPLNVLRQRAGADTLTLEIRFMGCQKDGVCYPPLARTLPVSLPDAPANVETRPSANNTATDGTRAPLGLLTALALALLGGLILNLMPCVLPILSLKALGLASSGESLAKARGHALWYSAGVVLSFAALGGVAMGLREAGLALGWGFQLQQPAVVGALALLMFAIGLALSGVFNVGGGLAGMGQTLASKTGPAGDFFTGVLVVVVAAPCTAPFMGAALAYAFAAPAAAAVGVFAALGLGLALPFLAIGFVPGLAQRLPRPGAWMNTLKQVLAFPMYLTAAWLVWVLAKQRGADAIGWLLGGAVVLALGLWAFERLRYKGLLARGAALLLIAAGLAVLWPVQRIQASPQASAVDGPGATPEQREGKERWSAERLAALRAEGRVVFVNMTADWCVSCKANEYAALGTHGFAAALAEAGGHYLVGDWTNIDPTITAYLQQYGAVGVPFYAVYPAGGGEPEILPNLLTPGIVSAALQRAANAGDAP